MKPSRFNHLLFTRHRVRKLLVASVATCSIKKIRRNSGTYMGCHSKLNRSIYVSLCSTETLLVHDRTSLVAYNTKVKHEANSEVADTQNNCFVLPNATNATHQHLATHVITPSCYRTISVFATLPAGHPSVSRSIRNAAGGMRYLISQSILWVLMSKATNPNMPRGSASLDSPAGVTLSLHPPSGLCPEPAKGIQPFRNLDGG